MQFNVDIPAAKTVTVAVSLMCMLISPGWADQPISLTTVPATNKPFAVAVGQRLQKPGKERITAAGALFLTNGKPQTSQVAVTWQIPLQVRIEGAGPTIVVNAGNSAAPAKRPRITQIQWKRCSTTPSKA